MNKLLCGSLLLFTMCCMSSCSLQRLITGKKTAVTTTVTPPDTTKVADNHVMRRAYLPEPDTFSRMPDTTGRMKKLVDLVTPVWNTRLNFTTLAGKAKVHFEGPAESQEFTASIRLRKDSVIWIDITALGGMVHAVRVLITPDSLLMLNYLQKEVTRVSLKDVAKVLPVDVDFASLQNIVTGDPLRTGSIVDVTDLGTSWFLHITDPGFLQTVSYLKADSTLTNNQLNTHETDGPQANIRLSRYEYSGERRISMSRVVNILNKQDKFLLEMDFQNVEFNNAIEAPFTVPAKFTLKQN